MHHFPFSLLDLGTFLLYISWFGFLVWFFIRLVRLFGAIEDIGRSLRVMAYDLREISDDLKAIRENLEQKETE